MAEALVFVVLQKIAAAIGEEVVNAGTYDGREIRYNIIQIQREFDVMQGFLRREDVQAASDQSFRSWLEHIRRLAYDVEDIMDEYAYLVGQKCCINSIVKERINYVKHAKTWREIAAQLKEVKGHLDHLSQMRIRYGITIPNGSKINRPNVDFIRNTEDYPQLIDENEVVGQVEERDRLLGWLNNNTYRDRAIISVHGMGGLGKTPLVRVVYEKEEIRRNFECRAFIFVSQNFQEEDLLRDLIRQIFDMEEIISRDIDHMNRQSLIQIIHNKLQTKRYLIVLDDVWTTDAWLSLSLAIPQNTNGSRVVITTRNEDVARGLANNNWLLTMGDLSEEDALLLLKRRVFGNLMDSYPQELEVLAGNFVERCQRLPLAIVAIGTLLSFMGMNVNEWRLFYNRLNWELLNNPGLSSVANVLNLSYDNLPTYLKNCFLYCSLLPEGFLIRRKWIIRLLIAEGFIEDVGPDTTLEEVAESYLVELARRSLLQVVERNVNGRAKSFIMHDLVREICVAKAGNKKFGIGCNNRLSPLDRKARRIFIHNMSKRLLPTVGSSNLRSLLLFQKELSLPEIKSTLANLRLLCVLSLRWCNIASLPDVVFELFNLHYLDLSFTKIKVIPKLLGNLKLLQTLDLRDTSVKELPDEIKYLSKLRHLFAKFYRDYQVRKYISFFGVKVTPNICDFEDVQTLHCIEANSELVLRLGNLVHLRNLFLLNVKGSHIGDLWSSIAQTQFLSALGIIACNKNEVLNLQNVGTMPGLEKLYLKGKLKGGVIPAVFSSFTKMRELKLGWLGLKENPSIIESFFHMPNLVRLHLYRIYEGQSLTFGSGWFPKLQFLYLADLLELNCIIIEDGSMKNLQFVNLIGLTNLKHVPQGMQHLHAIKGLNLTDMPDEFISNLKENEWKGLHKISSITETTI